MHGRFNGTIRVDEENQAIIANGNVIRMIYASDPATVDYEAYGIRNAIVIDNTGAWRDEAGLGQHLKAKGATKVIVTAPGKGAIKNIVSGVNSHLVESSDAILAAASCTTNAVVPVLKAMQEKFGTPAALRDRPRHTNDQNLIDNFHKKIAGAGRRAEYGHHGDRRFLGCGETHARACR